MAHDLKISNALAIIEADAAKVRFNNGYLRIYQGTKPASADDTPTGCTLLAELRFAATAYVSQVNGLITMAALTPEDSALAGGTADWYRALESDGTTPIADGTCGLGGGGYDCEMATTTIVIGQEVSCTTFTHQVRKGA
jgi:hypothetical protein